MKQFVKTLKKALIIVVIGLIPTQMFSWPGMETPPLSVQGRYLVDPCGNNVNLHGVAMTASPWFNGCMYGSEHCRWNDYDVQGALDYNMAVMDRLTNTSDGWYLSYVRLHIDPYWTNDPGPAIPEHDISRFNYDRLVTYTDQVIIPLINHAQSRGMYVVLRPPGVCPERIAVNDEYHDYLKTVWNYLSQHPQLRNVDHVMFELANEPVEILGTNGQWGATGQAHFDALKNYFQPIVDIIRNNGANNICWIPGTGWQSHYAGYANNPITGGNIGYAVHIYPGYWGGVRNYTAFQNAWDEHVKPVADFAPIIITETDWVPQSYKDADHYGWGVATTGTAEGDGFGANLNHITYHSGNVSWNVLAPENLIHMGDPNGSTAYNGDWQACAAPVKHWFSEFADTKIQNNIPTSNCISPPPDDPTPPSDPPPPSGDIIDGGNYRVTPRHSGKAMDSQWGGTENGTNVQQWSWLNNNAQTWRFTNVAGNYWRVSPLHATNLALDVHNWSSDNGTNVQLWQYGNNQENQQWELIDQGNGYYLLRNRHSGKCLDVTDWSTEDGANFQQWDCWGGDTQQFSFAQVSSAEEKQEGIMAKTSEKVVIYPNPVNNGRLNVELSGMEEGQLSIKVLDIRGKIILEHKTMSNHTVNIDVNDLRTGVYILKVENESQNIVRKFTVK